MSANHEKYYLIGEVISLTGATREMLRNYERNGYIQPITAGENNYRLYSAEDIRKIVKIGVLDELGLDTKTAKKVSIGRNAMREILASQDFDLSGIIEIRAEELKKIIEELLGDYFLALFLKNSILPYFSEDKEDSELESYVKGLSNAVSFSKQFLSALKKTAIMYFDQPKSLNELFETIYNPLNMIKNFKEKIEFVFIENDYSDSINEKLYITALINSSDKIELMDYINRIDNGLLDEEQEVSKAIETLNQSIQELYSRCMTKYRLIPERNLPELLDVTYIIITEQFELSTHPIVEITVEMLNYLLGKQNSYKDYLRILFDKFSETAKKNYAETIAKGIDIADKTPLYELFEKLY